MFGSRNIIAVLEKNLYPVAVWGPDSVLSHVWYRWLCHLARLSILRNMQIRSTIVKSVLE